MVGKPVRNYDAHRADAGVRARPLGRRPGGRRRRPTNSSLEEAAARYGVAFLAVRRIADRYGEEKMLDFFGRVVHDDESLDKAARAALGASWTTVRADCARFIRTSVA